MMNNIFEVHLKDVPEKVTDLTNQRNLLLNQHNEMVSKVHNLQYVLYAVGAIALVAVMVYLTNNRLYASSQKEEQD